MFNRNLILLTILLTGCLSEVPSKIPEQINDLDNLTVYPADAEPVYSIKLAREQTFGDTDEVYFGSMRSVAVDVHDRVFIADFYENKVVIFQPDGSYLASVGRTGSGPGEARQTSKIIIRSNLLYVYDHEERRVNVFTMPPGPHAVPEFSHTTNITGEQWNRVAEPDDLLPSLHSVRSDGAFLVYASATPYIFREDVDAQGFIRYHLLDRDGGYVSDVIFEKRMPRHIVTEWFLIPPPFYGRGLMAVSHDDRIFSAWSDDFLIKVHDPDGNYQRAFYRPIDKRPLNREEAINSMDEHEQIERAVRNLRLPKTWPALNSIMADDENRLWVSTIVDDDEVYEWWVLQTTGEVIAKFEWPRDEPIELVKNGYFYSRETNEETGLQRIVRYHIELEER